MQEPVSQQPEFLEAENITPTPRTPSRNYTPGEFPRDSPEDLERYPFTPTSDTRTRATGGGI